MKKLFQVSGKHTVGGIVFYKHLFLVLLLYELVKKTIDVWFLTRLVVRKPSYKEMLEQLL